MITADKVFKGTTPISKIYQGLNLVWEQPVTKYVKWDPTTYISNDSYTRTIEDRRITDYVKLYIKGYTSVTITLSYTDPHIYQEDQYIYAWRLDNTSSGGAYVKLENNGRRNNRKSYTYSIPNDSLEHFIYFEVYSGFYNYADVTFEISYSNLV